MTSTRMIQIQQRITSRISSWTSASLCCGKFGSRISGEPVQSLSKGSVDIARSKSYYLQQVHQPRHLSKSARLFGPDVLEVDITHFQPPIIHKLCQILTVCHWWVIPMVWLPITVYLFLRSIFQFEGALPAFTVNPALPVASLTEVPADAFVKALLCFFTGNLIWTLLEYTLHRFLFHIDEYLPDRPFFLMLHFLMHGIHHFMPMDR